MLLPITQPNKLQGGEGGHANTHNNTSAVCHHRRTTSLPNQEGVHAIQGTGMWQPSTLPAD